MRTKIEHSGNTKKMSTDSCLVCKHINKLTKKVFKNNACILYTINDFMEDINGNITEIYTEVYCKHCDRKIGYITQRKS